MYLLHFNFSIIPYMNMYGIIVYVEGIQDFYISEQVAY